mmetsp:Transcript_7129/g.8199  ORF Transcript_7129/g.8199 Transcript_7129/m.8199 type:complete len:116 (+) Transcript_7129:37-384(+)
MSVTGRVGIGIPTVLLHEGEGHTITVESKHGEIYRGFLHESEDNMNVFMKNVTYTNKNGKTSKLEQVYIRGDQITFVILPDILAEAPMFARVVKHKATKGKFTPQGSGTARAGRR